MVVYMTVVPLALLGTIYLSYAKFKQFAARQEKRNLGHTQEIIDLDMRLKEIENFLKPKR